MIRMLSLALVSALLATSSPMIMRNNALMSKMVSQFQGKDSNRLRENQPKLDPFPDENPQERDTFNPDHVVSVMQNVLCKNFPTIPCELITKDDTLRHLIEKSIQQLKYKKMAIERTTPPPNYQLTLFPIINSEDLSNFLQVSNTGSFKPKKKKQKNLGPEKNHERKNNSRTAVINGRKKIRKFYPHKYKDKGDKDFRDYSEEKLSMSVENPLDHNANIKRKHFSQRGDTFDPPVWRIDYMKHGEPSINMYGYEDSLKGKIIKTGPNVIVDDNILDQVARRDVLHPDVYIKKSYSRKSNADTSEPIE